ncbi:MAG: flagellar hook capping FlgD N-terminal domain-containing protein [Fibrobacterota bacterium]
MSNDISTTDTVYSGKDYIDSLTKKAEAEKLVAGFGVDGLSTKNAAELAATRKSNKLFTGDQQLGKNDFLKLLTAQLKYQDPMEPVSNENFVAQMAQFSSLESMNNISESVTGMDDSYHKSLTLQQESSDALQKSTAEISAALNSKNTTDLAMNNALTAGLIGKDVRVKVDQVAMTLGVGSAMAPKRLFFSTDTPANDVKIRILDKNNKPVRVMNVETISDQYKFKQNGDYSVVFDGKDDKGDTVAAGTYKIEMIAQNGSTSVKGTVFEQGMVGGIDYTADGTKLQIKSQDYDAGSATFYSTTIPIASVVSVREHYEE